jgi:uncharacterized protein (DUF1697 family)
MKFVAFIRNLNVGQAGFPTRSQLEQAFLVSGARQAVSFQSNGTVVLELDGNIGIPSFTRGVTQQLRADCGFAQAIFIRELAIVKETVRKDPFASVDCNGFSHKNVSYFDYPGRCEDIFPIESPQRDCLIFGASTGEAYSISRDVNGRSGYPTPVLEQVLHVPATTRSWTTIQRLAAKF